jgi:hypothetical protein
LKWREWIGKLDYVQQGLWFKVVASVVVILIGLATLLSLTVARAAAEPATPPGASAPTSPTTPTTPAAPAPPAEDDGAAAAAAAITSILDGRNDLTSASVGIGLAVAVALVVVWLGVALTYLALGCIAIVVAGILPLLGVPRDAARLGLGAVALGAAFIALMRGARMLLSYPHPIIALARHVLDEAVRMRVSAIFVVLIIFAMASLPGLLDDTQPLRYRVQSFLQYGTGGIFWLISLLIILFSVATVTFDQRDRTIWQTMTKPVSPFSYVLGKWLGLAVLSAVLLSVCGAGVFLFTSYLRSQPALGERIAFVAMGQESISEDRLILETQVLTARRTVEARGAPVNEEAFEQNVRDKVAAEMARLGELSADPAERRAREQFLDEKIRSDLRKNVEASFRFIPPAQAQVYTFEGLQDARDSNRPLIFRFRADSGTNAPDATRVVSFAFRGGEIVVRKLPPGQFSSFPILASAIDANGTVEVQIFNGDVVQELTNAEGISFPKDGLQLSFAVGSYRVNFLRVMAVFWVKLAFLAMVGVALGTFLSFPVATLVALTVFFAAEGAGFLTAALENFWTEDAQGQTMYFNTVVAWVAEWIAWAFRTYSDLRPTERLVEGKLLPWSEVAYGTLVLGIWTIILYVGGVLVFARRELAIYSGHS